MADHQCLLTRVQRDPRRTLRSAQHQTPQGHFGIEWFNGSEGFKYPATAQPTSTVVWLVPPRSKIALDYSSPPSWKNVVWAVTKLRLGVAFESWPTRI